LRLTIGSLVRRGDRRRPGTSRTVVPSATTAGSASSIRIRAGRTMTAQDQENPARCSRQNSDYRVSRDVPLGLGQCGRQEDDDEEGAIGGTGFCHTCPHSRQTQMMFLCHLRLRSRCLVSTDWHLGHGGDKRSVISRSGLIFSRTVTIFVSRLTDSTLEVIPPFGRFGAAKDGSVISQSTIAGRTHDDRRWRRRITGEDGFTACSLGQGTV
jgi:hypothetical protein